MKKRLTLSSNKFIAGVCGGIADYLNLDPTLVRIICVLLIIVLKFPIVIAYVFCWAIFPNSNSTDNN